jgi:hypothetical protein
MPVVARAALVSTSWRYGRYGSWRRMGLRDRGWTVLTVYYYHFAGSVWWVHTRRAIVLLARFLRLLILLS